MSNFVEKNSLPDFSVRTSYIEDNPSASFLTQRHNCDVKKDSDKSNHTILKISS